MAVGRYLAETVASVPHFSKAEFESLMEVRCTLRAVHALLRPSHGSHPPQGNMNE